MVIDRHNADLRIRTLKHIAKLDVRVRYVYLFRKIFLWNIGMIKITSGLLCIQI